MLKLHAESPEKIRTIRDIILEWDRTVDWKKLDKDLKGKSIIDMMIEVKEKRSSVSWDEFVKSVKGK